MADYPKPNKDEYEWLSCIVLPGGETTALYRYKPTNTPVLICNKDDQAVVIHLSSKTVRDIKDNF